MKTTFKIILIRVVPVTPYPRLRSQKEEVFKMGIDVAQFETSTVTIHLMHTAADHQKKKNFATVEEKLCNCTREKMQQLLILCK